MDEQIDEAICTCDSLIFVLFIVPETNILVAE